jgi:hypothetical protein
MEIKDFLQKLLDFGKQEGYFEETTIGQLDKSCCKDSITTIIDFDRAKDIIVSEFELQTLKSSDALKISPLPGNLDFIELKGFKKFIKHQFRTGDPAGIQIREKVENFDLVSKIRDSIYILQTIVLSRKLELSKKELTVFYKIPKKFIIVVDIELDENPIEYIALSLSFLSETSTSIEKQISDIVKKEIDKIPGSSFNNIQKPQLMNCKSIDDYYVRIDSTI